MNLLTYPHSVGTLLRISFRLYQNHWLAMLTLTLVLLMPSMLLAIVGGMQADGGSLFQMEQLAMTLMMGVLEATMALGVIALAAGTIFPTGKLLNLLRSRMFFGAVHIAVLLYMIRFLGLTGVMLPFPMNFLLVAFWMLSHFFFALAQQVYAIEGLRGLQALIRSFRLVRQNLPRVFSVTLFSYAVQIGILFLVLQLFLPSLDSAQNLTMEMDEQQVSMLEQLLTSSGFLQSISWAQHLTALIFAPFAALLSALLYFDLAHREPDFPLQSLDQAAQQLFGASLRTSAPSEDTVELSEAAQQPVPETPEAPAAESEKSAETTELHPNAPEGPLQPEAAAPETSAEAPRPDPPVEPTAPEQEASAKPGSGSEGPSRSEKDPS